MPTTNGHGPKKKRAILYARVSTDEQAQSGYSLSQQIEALREYVTREGYEVLEEVKDPGQSGATLARPGMDRVRDLVAAGGVSVVLAQDRDRFARKPAYNYLLQEEFAERGCELKALNDYGDDSPEGILMRGIQDQFAEYERAKTAERTRRGKLRRAREGKIIPTSRPDFGFRYNTARDNYMVDVEQMRIVERIFYMVGVEGMSIRGVKRVFEREGLFTPNGKHNWSTSFIRGCILDDVYKPHTYKEVKLLVSTEVAARLDPERRYGIWWFNRERATYTQTAEDDVEGRRYYRRRVKRTTKPAIEWIAIPVPDPGIPREWVDAAREAIANNERPSRNGGRSWELSGGILRCAACGWRMRTLSVRDPRSDKRNYYYRCPKLNRNVENCPNRKSYRADRVESQVWDFVSGLLKDPERLRIGIEKTIEQERKGLRGDPDREARAWADKLVEVDNKRARFQDMAAEGLIDFDELRAKLTTLEKTRETARRELAALKGLRERLTELERDRDALMERYARMVHEDLDALTPEERHHVYKLLKLRVSLQEGRALKVSGTFGGALEFCKEDRVSGSPGTPRSSLPAWSVTSSAL